MTAKTMLPISSGTHPPCANFARLAATNPPSTQARVPATAAAAGHGQRQTWRMAVNSSTVVIIIVVDTAIP